MKIIFLFTKNKDGKHVVVRNGIKSEEYNNIFPTTVWDMYSSTGKYLGFSVTDEDWLRYAVINGKAEKKYLNWLDIKFAPDESFYAYIGDITHGEKSVLVVNGEEVMEMGPSGDLEIAGDSKTINFIDYVDEWSSGMNLMTYEYTGEKNNSENAPISNVDAGKIEITPDIFRVINFYVSSFTNWELTEIYKKIVDLDFSTSGYSEYRELLETTRLIVLYKIYEREVMSY